MLPRHGSRWLSLALGGVAALAIAVRIPSIAEPLGIDQSLWASAVRGMERGQLLYRDVWEQRPPGIYVTYLTAFRLLGWSSSTVAWLDIFASAVTTCGLFAIVRRLATGPAAALTAALYAALTVPGWLYRYDGFLERSVCETFIVAAIALAAWCAVAFAGSGSMRAALGVGFFVGVAVVYKPNAGLYLPALLLWMWLYRRDEQPRTWLARVVAAGAASAIVPLLSLLWLWRLGLLADARIAVVDFNRMYVAAGFTLGGYALKFSQAVWLRMKTDPLWLAGGLGAVAAAGELVRQRRLDPLAGLAVIWGAGAASMMAVNGIWLFNSYFIPAFAPLAIMAAWLLSSVFAPVPPWRRAIGAAAGLVMLFVLVDRHYLARVAEWTRADLDALGGREAPPAYFERFGGYGNNRGYSARANIELADYVRAHTGVDERIYLFGINGAGVYFASDRLTAHRFLRVNFFVPGEFPDPRFRLESVVADLVTRRPRYLIFERLNSSSEMGQAVDRLPSDPRVRQLLAGYRLEATIEDFSLFRREDIGGRP